MVVVAQQLGCCCCCCCCRFRCRCCPLLPRVPQVLPGRRLLQLLLVLLVPCRHRCWCRRLLQLPVLLLLVQPWTARELQERSMNKHAGIAHTRNAQDTCIDKSASQSVSVDGGKASLCKCDCTPNMHTRRYECHKQWLLATAPIKSQCRVRQVTDDDAVSSHHQPHALPDTVPALSCKLDFLLACLYSCHCPASPPPPLSIPTHCLNTICLQLPTPTHSAMSSAKAPLSHLSCCSCCSSLISKCAKAQLSRPEQL